MWVRLLGLVGAVLMLALAGNVSILNVLEPNIKTEVNSTVNPDGYPIRFQQVVAYTGIEPVYHVSNDLSLGLGLGLPSPAGYVNVSKPEDTVWLKYERTADGLTTTYIYIHEYAHVLQKHVIANMNNNIYPSTWDLVGSYGFYLNTLQLNQELSEYRVEEFMKPRYLNTMERLSGLEANADCVAEWFGVPSLKMSYTEQPCSLQSLAAAYLIIHGLYPDPDSVTRFALLIESGKLKQPFVKLPKPEPETPS